MGNTIRTHSALLMVLSLYAPQVLSANLSGDGGEGGQDSIVLSWYMPGAMSGDAEAQYNLGYLYEAGWGVDPNRGQAIHWYRQAANNQHILSQLRLGMMLYAGIGTNPDQEEGIKWLRSAANSGNQVALRLTDKIITDLGPSGEDIQIIRKAYRLLEEGETRVVEALDAEVPTRMAATGNELPEPNNPRSAGESFKTGPARQNIATPSTIRNPAPNELHNVPSPASAPVVASASSGGWEKYQLDESDFSFKPRTTSTPSKLEEVGGLASVKPALTEVPAPAPIAAADAGVEFNLGVTLLKGQGVTRDEAQGMKWLRAAAARNHEIASKYVKLLDQAEGNAANVPALQSLLKAARWWDVDAFFEIGRLYDSGQMTSRDSATAQQWYQLASTLGNRDATVALSSAPVVAANQNFAPFAPRTKAETASASMFDTAMVDASQGKRMSVFKAMAIIAILSALAVWLLRTLSRMISARRTQAAPPTFQRSNPRFSTHSSGPLVVEVNDVEFMRDLWGADKGTVVEAGSEGKGAGRANRASIQPDETSSQARAPQSTTSSTAIPTNVAPRVEPTAAQRPTSTVQQPLMAGAESVVVSTVARSAAPAVQDIPTVTARVAGPTPTVFADQLAKPQPYKKQGATSTASPARSPAKAAETDKLSFNRSDIQPKIHAAPEKAKMQFEYRAETVVDATQPSIGAGATAVNVQDASTLGRVQYNIAMMFARGDGVVRNDILAAKWFEKSAKLGNPESQFRMWALCSTGRSNVPLDPKQAHHWLQSAASAGHAPAVEVLNRQKQRTPGQTEESAVG
ncbi:MAG: hypothetical protein OEW08_03220 [Gammaproteobacteria bacterium]|nr:hypothetical protein [Gammaproteobacteria bacterium]